MTPEVPLSPRHAPLLLQVSLFTEFLPGPTRLVLRVVPLVLLMILLPKAFPTDGARMWGALPGGHLPEAWGTQSSGVWGSFPVGGFPGMVGCWEESPWIVCVWLHEGDASVRPEGNISTYS